MILRSVQELCAGKADFGLKPDLQGWGSDDPIFSEIVLAAKPKCIVEVGCWKGQSALKLAQLCPEAIVITVDTFLGSHEHMGTNCSILPTDHGFPVLWWQMLTNLHDKPEANRIFPVPQTSRTASRLIGTLPLKPDLVFIDGDHSFGATYDDMFCYWRLLGSGGTMYGDDFHDAYFPGVRADAMRFAYDYGLHLEDKGRFWRLVKA